MLARASEALDLIDEDTDEAILILIQHRFNHPEQLSHKLAALAKVLAEQRMSVELDKLEFRKILSQANSELLGQASTQSCLSGAWEPIE